MTTITFDQGKQVADPGLVRACDAVAAMQAEIPALLFEMQAAKGNWPFKDNVLKKLVPEFHARVDKLLGHFQAARDEYFRRTSPGSRDPDNAGYPRWDRELAIRHDLVKCIAGWFKREIYLPPEGKEIHDQHSHASLETLLRRASARFTAALDHLHVLVTAQVIAQGMIHVRSVVSAWVETHAPAFIGDIKNSTYFDHVGLPEDLVPACMNVLTEHDGRVEYELGQRGYFVGGMEIRHFVDPSCHESDRGSVLVWSRQRGPIFNLDDVKGHDDCNPAGAIDLATAITSIDAGNGEDAFGAWIFCPGVLGALAWDIYGTLDAVNMLMENVEGIKIAAMAARGALVKQYGTFTPAIEDLVKAFVARYGHLKTHLAALATLYPDLVPKPAAGSSPVKEDATP